MKTAIELAKELEAWANTTTTSNPRLLWEAADWLESQAKEIERLTAALEPFSEFGQIYFRMNPKSEGLYSLQVGEPDERHLTRAHFDAALSALSPTKGE